VASGATLGEVLLLGAFTGLTFHPLVSVGSLTVSGALMGARGVARWRVVAGFALLAFAWAFADGRLAWVYAADAQAQGEAIPWVFLATWALVGLAAGYVVPALVGRAVGTRVTHGTGWISAIAIAVGLSLAIGSIGGGGVLWFAQ
jgi:hypothetical protein